MAQRIQDHGPIALPMPEKEIFYRLGGHAGKSGMSEAFLDEYKKICREAFALCEARGRTRVLDVCHRTEEGVVLSSGELLKGRQFAVMLENCDKVWCAAATVGRRIVEARDAQTSVTAKSIYDAVGSECAEKAIHFLHGEAIRTFLRHGEIVSPNRYSPGYGDMPLETQKIFFHLLQLEELDLTLTDDNFIVPEKTVTAWAGITVLGGKRQ